VQEPKIKITNSKPIPHIPPVSGSYSGCAQGEAANEARQRENKKDGQTVAALHVTRLRQGVSTHGN
jgi:hypothetical protein